MANLSAQLDAYLLDLSWSLWTELGVAGVKRQHQDFLIDPEELILLTSAIMESDPRLRDEALDWCVHNHHYISVSRLRVLAKALESYIAVPFSLFSTTVNAVAGAHWPTFTSVSPLTFVPSNKSMLPKLDMPALLYFRLRTLFGVSARADVLAFFLSEEKTDFAAADVAEIGYSKRSIFDILEGFSEISLLHRRTFRNQQRYSFEKRAQMEKIVGPIPKYFLSWRHLLEVLLSLRGCIKATENKSLTTKVVEMRNLLLQLENKLRVLRYTPPAMQADIQVYWESLSRWLLDKTQAVACPGI